MIKEEQKNKAPAKHIQAVQFLEHERQSKVLPRLATFVFQPPKEQESADRSLGNSLQ